MYIGDATPRKPYLPGLERWSDYKTLMIEQVKYSFEAGRAMRALTATHYLFKGYFIPRRGP